MDDFKPAAASIILTQQTADIVSAYVSHNAVQTASLPELITSVYASLSGLGTPSALVEPEVVKVSAAEIRKSIKPNALISFVDGKPYKTLKRHLSGHGLDAAGYRAKYGLPHDYPMVAPSYAAHRSELAKRLGLGQLRRTGTGGAATGPGEAETAPEATDAAEAPPKRRGRPRKAETA